MPYGTHPHGGRVYAAQGVPKPGTVTAVQVIIFILAAFLARQVVKMLLELLAALTEQHATGGVAGPSASMVIDTVSAATTLAVFIALGVLATRRSPVVMWSIAGVYLACAAFLFFSWTMREWSPPSIFSVVIFTLVAGMTLSRSSRRYYLSKRTR
ncbi:hypothetical protein [Nocardiopsis rhodophaea]